MPKTIPMRICPDDHKFVLETRGRKTAARRLHNIISAYRAMTGL
jgi:hypothetical protein